MAGFKDQNFNDRRSTSADAKKALLERFRARPAADDPEIQARLAERQKIAEARAARTAEREAAKQAEAERRAAEAAEREAAMEIERKAARDARYAARKARRK